MFEQLACCKEIRVLSSFGADIAIPLAAEPIFKVFGLTITNSMFFGVISAIIVVSILLAVARRSTVRPKSKFAFAVEALVDYMFDLCVQNFGDRKTASRFFPLLFTLFFFILFSNLSSLIPGVGTINIAYNGTWVPLFRAFTIDLNATLAMAVLVSVLVQVVAIRELGLKKHLEHYFTNKPWNPMNIVLGLIEVLSELIRVITLSMRLFGVMYAGEVLIHVFGILGGYFGWASMFPVYVLEAFYCLIQAYVFMMLSTVYLAMGMRHEDVHAESTDNDHSTEQLSNQKLQLARE